MKTERNQDWDPKNKRTEPSEEQQLEQNHLDKPGERQLTEVEIEEEEEEIEEDDDDDDGNNIANNQKPESNTNLEENRSAVDEVKDIESVEGNKITNRETEIVNKEGQ